MEAIYPGPDSRALRVLLSNLALGSSSRPRTYLPPCHRGAGEHALAASPRLPCRAMRARERYLDDVTVPKAWHGLSCPPQSSILKTCGRGRRSFSSNVRNFFIVRSFLSMAYCSATLAETCAAIVVHMHAEVNSAHRIAGKKVTHHAAQAHERVSERCKHARVLNRTVIRRV